MNTLGRRLATVAKLALLMAMSACWPPPVVVVETAAPLPQTAPPAQKADELNSLPQLYPVDHARVMEALMMNHDELRHELWLGGESPSSPKEVLEAALNIKGIDPANKRVIREVLEMKARLDRARRRVSSEDERAIEEIKHRVEDSDSIPALLKRLGTLEDDPKFARFRDAIEESIEIIRDGERTIYSPDFFRDRLHGSEGKELGRKCGPFCRKAIILAVADGGGAIGGCLECWEDCPVGAVAEAIIASTGALAPWFGEGVYVVRTFWTSWH